MADVERLLADYIAEHRAGGAADPLEYMNRLGGTEREELGELIDAYLARAPGRPWEPEAFPDSPAERLSEAIERSLSGQAGLWPVILPRLRERAEVKRSQVVAELAATLGLLEREHKVARYYHEMERGLLPSTGVSGRVLEALGAIVGASAGFLRRAGEPFGAGPGPAEGPVFARTARPSPEHERMEELAAPAAERRAEEPGWDEVDELFRGGG
jgi:hypothetical protein